MQPHVQTQTASAVASSPQPWASAVDRQNDVSGTAEGACFARAAAARESDAGVANPDYLAKYFLGPWYRSSVALMPVSLARMLFERKLPGGYASHAARTRHCDRMLQDALDAGARQLVILGAGYDTRAYRFSSKLANVSIFEVDLPATQARKQACLRKLYGTLPAHVQYVPINFARQSLSDVLLAAGYDPSLRTHFNWEGVTYYIDEPAVSNVLACVRQHTARGSTIVFDYWLRSFVEGDFSTYGAKQLVQYAVVEQQEPFLFGLNQDEIAAFMHERGFEIASDLGPQELSAAYLMRANGRALAPPWGAIRMCCARTS